MQIGKGGYFREIEIKYKRKQVKKRNTPEADWISCVFDELCGLSIIRGCKMRMVHRFCLVPWVVARVGSRRL